MIKIIKIKQIALEPLRWLLIFKTSLHVHNLEHLQEMASLKPILTAPKKFKIKRQIGAKQARQTSPREMRSMAERADSRLGN